MLKNKLGNDMVNVGMEVPFQEEIKAGYNKAKTQFLHSKKCKELRASRHKKFNKVRVVYFNLMVLLTGIILISVCRIMYDVIRIAKM